MTVASTIVDPPINADDLRGLQALLRAQWDADVTLRVSWATRTREAASRAEQRRQLLAAPMLGVEASLFIGSIAETTNLLAELYASGRSRSLVPLYSERVRTTTTQTLGATLLTTDPTKRRFGINTRISLYHPDSGINRVARITGISSTGFTIDAADQDVGLTVPVGTWVHPLIETRVRPSASASMQTDRVGRAALDAQTLPGVWNPAPVATQGAVPAGFDSYDGIPVYAPPRFDSDIEVSVDSGAELSPSGTSQTVDLAAGRPKRSYRTTLTLKDRTEIWKLMQLFDASAGRTHPFMFVSPLAEFEPIAASGSVLDVKRTNVNWSDVAYLALLQRNGTILISQVVSVTRFSTYDRVTLEDAVEGLVLRKVSVAIKARFASDELAISFVTDSLASAELSVTELQNEKSVTISGLTTPASTPLSTAFIVSLCYAGCDGSITFPCMHLAEGPFLACIAGYPSNVQDFLGNLYYGFSVTTSCEWVEQVFGFNLCSCGSGSWTDSHGNTYAWSPTGNTCTTCGDGGFECCDEYTFTKL